MMKLDIQMFAVPFRKVSKTRKRMRRSHNAMELPGVAKCPSCGEMIKPHRVCPNCGTYKGKKVSVQGTGMGQPSLSIYVNELFQFYNVQTAIRVGTCGAINKNIHVRDTILANSACTDSAIITQRFGNLHYAPSANFDLLYTAYNKAKENNINVCIETSGYSKLVIK